MGMMILYDKTYENIRHYDIIMDVRVFTLLLAGLRVTRILFKNLTLNLSLIVPLKFSVP